MDTGRTDGLYLERTGPVRSLAELSRRCFYGHISDGGTFDDNCFLDGKISIGWWTGAINDVAIAEVDVRDSDLWTAVRTH